MAFTTAEVNTWFQTIDGLPVTTAPIPSNLSTAYVNGLNSIPPTTSEPQVQAQLENQTAPPPNNVATDTFYRTSVAQFVLREFQAAWGTVPTSTQFDAWVARVIANPTSCGKWRRHEPGARRHAAISRRIRFDQLHAARHDRVLSTSFW